MRSVLCEGGPTLNASLLPAGLVDELFLCIAPRLAGSAGSLTIAGSPPLGGPVELDLVWLLESDGALFARYALCQRCAISDQPSTSSGRRGSGPT